MSEDRDSPMPAQPWEDDNLMTMPGGLPSGMPSSTFGFNPALAPAGWDNGVTDVWGTNDDTPVHANGTHFHSNLFVNGTIHDNSTHYHGSVPVNPSYGFGFTGNQPIPNVPLNPNVWAMAEPRPIGSEPVNQMQLYNPQVHGSEPVNQMQLYDPQVHGSLPVVTTVGTSAEGHRTGRSRVDHEDENRSRGSEAKRREGPHPARDVLDDLREQARFSQQKAREANRDRKRLQHENDELRQQQKDLKEDYYRELKDSVAEDRAALSERFLEQEKAFEVQQKVFEAKRAQLEQVYNDFEAKRSQLERTYAEHMKHHKAEMDKAGAAEVVSQGGVIEDRG
ncbi:hypothetical protein C8F04DRAFT_1179549 [Mycena alexandri]|uniref:Uncharacterized protein n=1 Tax=Mycena alexandri TaxID=1745969 RepID=A0AAD6T4Y0_9AGAR|nr:hypothetical protein C8F04DRAFT_1179549 [Mycena alexandri]